MKKYAAASTKVPNKGDFLQYLEIRHGLVKETAIGYFSRIKVFLEWAGERKLDSSLLEEFLSYLRNKGYSEGTLNSFLFAVRKYEEYLLTRDGTESNITKGFKTRRPYKKAVEYLSVQEVEKLLNTRLTYKKHEERWEKTEDTLIAFTQSLYYLGCRFSELHQLVVRNVNLSDLTLVLEKTKNKEVRVLPIVEPLRAILKKQLKGKGRNDLVFTNMNGGPIHSPDFIKNIKKRAKVAGISDPDSVHPHMLRHSFATHLAEAGIELGELAYILGHSDPETTYNVYIKWQTHKIRIAMNKLPLARKHTPPIEIIRNVVEAFRGFRLEEDRRFSYKLDEGSQSLNLQLFVK